MESKIEINAIVWSLDIEAARKFAQTFTEGTKTEAGFYTVSTPEYTLNTYVRCPSEPNNATSKSITDIVMVHVEDPSECEEAKNYLDSRRGIPFKICLTTNFGELDELECKNVNPSELATEKILIIKEALSFEKTLVNVFKKFDINGNGLISTEELMSCSKELGHELTQDDAQMITNTLDKDNKGNIDFNGFKKWWVTGKSDFAAFRRVVKAEMAVHKLVKLTSTNFNDYLSNLKEDSNNVAANEVQQSININLHANENFENGIGLFMDICSGQEAKEIFESYPEKIRNSPAFISLTLELETNEIAVQTAEMLNQMIVPMIDSIPQVAMALQMGAKVEFRANQNNLIADVTVGAMMAEMILQSTSQYNMKDLNAGGEGTIHIFSAADVNDILTTDLKAWEVVQKVLNMKLHLSSKAFYLRNAIGAICDVMDTQVDQGVLPYNFKSILNGIRIGSILRSLDVDFKFDPTPILDLILLKSCKGKVGEEGFKQLNLNDFKQKFAEGEDSKIAEEVGRFRGKLAAMVQSISEAKDSVPPEFLQIFKALNMEKIQLQYGVNTEQAKVSFKMTLNLPGMNKQRDEILK